MRALRLAAAKRPLEQVSCPLPEPGADQIRLRVRACGVCRTDLHLLDGELEGARYPIVPGHQIVGIVDALGPDVESVQLGQRIGVPWLAWTCGVCSACRSGHENLCSRAQFTGCQRDGGYAEYAVADARYCFALPERYGDVEVAPLLCAGLIGYRALRMAGDAERIGLYGFGASAHLVAQVIRGQGRSFCAFTRPGDTSAQRFAGALGASWAGGSDELPPASLDAALIFAPVGGLVPQALRAVRPGATVVCAGIHMSQIPAFPYAWLWGERCVRSVAHLTRRDGQEFFALAARLPLKTHTRSFPLEEAGRALELLRGGELLGAAVLEPGSAS